MDQTHQGKDVEYSEVLNIIQLCAEYFESEQLAEEDVFELVVDDQSNDIGEPVEALVEL